MSQQRTKERPDWKELRGLQRTTLFGEAFKSGCLVDLSRFRIWGNPFVSLLFISRVINSPLGLLSILFLTLRSQMYKSVYVVLNKFVWTFVFINVCADEGHSVRTCQVCTTSSVGYASTARQGCKHTPTDRPGGPTTDVSQARIKH